MNLKTLIAKKISAVVVILILLFPGGVFAQDLVEFKFKVQPEKDDVCITNQVNVTDNNNLITGSSTTTTQVGNVNCATSGVGSGKLDIQLQLTGFTPEAETSIKAALDSLAQSAKAAEIYKDMVQKMGGVLRIEKDSSGESFAYAAGAPNCAGSYIIVHNLNLEPLASAQYVIIHETGHILARCRPEIFREFMNQGVVDQDGPIITYPFSVYNIGCPASIAAYKYSEGFAETVTDYVVYKTYSYLPRSCTNYPGGPFPDYPSRQPHYYNFAKEQIFGGYEF